jgi:hypothetical protein
MERVGISIRVDSHGTYAEPLGTPDDAAGNFTAIGNQYFIEHVGILIERYSDVKIILAVLPACNHVPES